MNKTKQAIVDAIKALGYNQRQVSVRERPGGYSYSFTVTVRDAVVDMGAVEDAVYPFKSSSYCEASGEPLMGGNTYISVDATNEVEAIWAAPYISDVQAAIEACVEADKGVKINDKGYFLFKRNHYYSVYYHASDETFGGSIGYDHMNEPKSIALTIFENEQKIARAAKPAPAPQVEAIEEPAPAAIQIATGPVEIVQYSERAIAVFGNTKPIKDHLKAAGGKFNAFLKRGETTAAETFNGS